MSGVGLESRLRLEAARVVREVDPDGADDDLDMVEAAQVGDWDAELERLAHRGPGRPDRGGRGAAAQQPVRHGGGPAARRPRAVRPGAGEADAAQAVTGCALRHPVPRLGRGALRPAVTPRPGRPARPGRPRHRRRGRAAGADRHASSPARSPSGCRAPSSRPSPLVLAGQVVRGRIDAVYAEPDGGWLVVDWKTNQRQTADPLQLAIYRLAWAELMGVPLDGRASGVPLRAIGRDRRDQRPGRPQGSGAASPPGQPAGVDQFGAIAGLTCQNRI